MCFIIIYRSIVDKIYLLTFSRIIPPRTNAIAIIFMSVNDSLNIMNDAIKIATYTSAVASGIMYPRSYLATKYV